jgi:Rrf2 family protein
MRVSRAEEQAIRLAMRLAIDGDQRTLQELSAEEGIPEPTVAKVLAELRNAGLVRAIRGRKGGYELSRPPAAITVADLVQAVGPARFSGRFCNSTENGSGECERGDECRLRNVWDYLEAQLFRVLDQTTLADLLENDQSVRRHLDAVWREAGDSKIPETERIEPGRLAEAGR